LKYPCGICRKPVKLNQQGIQCDECQAWFHVKSNCCNINNEVYNSLANSSCTWICDQYGLPNFHSSLFNSSWSSLSSTNSFSALDSSLKSTGLTSTPLKQRGSSLRQAKPTCSRVNNGLKGKIINCNGLKGASRRIEFQALLDLHQPDIVLGCESKLDKEIPTYSVFPQNFTVFRNDRNCNGGGVFQAINSDIVCE